MGCTPERALPPTPPHSLVFSMGWCQVVLRLSGCVFCAALTAGLDAVFLPRLTFGGVVLSHSLILVAVLPLLIATLLLHETGHAAVLYIQGNRPVRITLQSGGAVCDAIIMCPTAGASLLCALAGPAVTAIITAALMLVWLVLPVPLSWHLAAKPIAIVGLVEGTFNTLPLHVRSDGIAVLRALLWLIWGDEPSSFAVLYVGRPLVLATVVVGVIFWGRETGNVPPGSLGLKLLVLSAFTLYIFPLITIIVRKQ